MSDVQTVAAPPAATCWDCPEKPWPELLKALKAGPFLPGHQGDESRLASLIATYRRERLTRPAIFIGAGTCGLGAGAGKTIEAVRAYLDQHQIEADVVETGCIGLCSEEPLLDVQLPARARVSFKAVTADKVPDILDHALHGSVPAGGVLGQFRDDLHEKWEEVPYLDEHPFFKSQKRWVLGNCGIIDPVDINEYIARGGYSYLARILRTQTPAEVCDIVERSGLRGRGGGGFPTGRKWKIAAQAAGDQKYLICNADEGDPGAFMDRAVIESDPHRLLEGMAIAAYAIGATKAYVYIRAEYPLAIKRLVKAMEQAREYGLIGPDVLGSGFDLDIRIKQGAGAFVCGEETALIHSIEGKRGMPRPRPPYPASQGLFGKPTVINNVETLANLADVIRLGWQGYSAVGTASSKGTKVFALSGMVSRTGLVEVPMGTTIRQIVFDVGGGIPGGRRCKAIQIGGPSGGCIPEQHLDIEIDYESLKNFGAIMGSGGLVVMDEGTCMVDIAKFFMQFIQSESCGKCIPCREGTRRLLEIIEAITRNRKEEEDLDALLRFQGILYMEQLAETIKDISFCGLGQTAPNPVLSTLRWFRDEYEAHIFERRCPAGACKTLAGAPCQSACPAGTEVWRYVAHIARGEYDDAYRVIRSAHPFPSICGRVCSHPCEEMCRCGTTGGEPIAVRALKRFVTDRVDPSIYQPEMKAAGPDAPKVAVIGAGPSGLTAANALSLKGCKVTVFEKESRPGGMLISGIPAFRLPREIVGREIDALLNPNIELMCGATLGRDLTIDGLFEAGYKAVYLAIGAHQSLKLDLDGEDLPGVYPSIAFLKAFNLSGKPLAKGRVGVIGGGNSAMDAARVALRQKGVKSVTLFYRRTRMEMPVYKDEIEAAMEEGIEIKTLVAPLAVVAEDGHLAGVRFIRNRLSTDRDRSGRARPVPIAGSEHMVPLDTLIVAISEQPETGALAGVDLARNGSVLVNHETLVTNRPGVFAGGDAVTGPGTVINAIGAGKRAAEMISRYLRGRQLRSTRKVELPSVYIEPTAGEEDETAPASRVRAPMLPLDLRQFSFAEVEQCLPAEAARCEARRCLRCDLEFTQPTESRGVASGFRGQ